MFSFVDAQPAVSWAVLDHDRRPKAAYHALVEACRPVIVVADRMPERVTIGDTVALDVNVVSDLRTPIEHGIVTAHIEWRGGEHRWRFAGTIDADACARIGMIRFVVPAAPGPLTLNLTLEGGDVAATNLYSTHITA
jgi:beta-mannosidase